MTNPEKVTVEQCDRELFNFLLGLDVTEDTRRILAGDFDGHVKMQAFARHRLASTPAPVDETVVERVAAIKALVRAISVFDQFPNRRIATISFTAGHWREISQAIAAMPAPAPERIKYDTDAIEAVQLLIERGKVMLDDQGYLVMVERYFAPAPDTAEREALVAALKPFADCRQYIAEDESDEEWAKFRLIVRDWRELGNVYDILLSAQGNSQ